MGLVYWTLNLLMCPRCPAFLPGLRRILGIVPSNFLFENATSYPLLHLLRGWETYVG